MQLKSLLKRILIIIIFLVLILLTALFLYFIPKNSNRNNSEVIIKKSTTSLSQEQEGVELPVRLKIPSINIDTPVEPVGLTSDGLIDMPKNINKVVWLNTGPYPGEEGSAIIAGHYGWKNNMPAIFNDLHKLLKGDQILVVDEKGDVTTFVVHKIKIYDKDEATPDVFTSNDGKAHLNLITCTGEWNEAEKTRSERLVVFTEKK